MLALTALASCGPTGQPVGQQIAPTVAPVFRPAVPTSLPLVSTPGQRPAAVPTPEGPSDDVVASRLGTNVRRVPIFDNGLNTDWSRENSTGLRDNLKSRS